MILIEVFAPRDALDTSQRMRAAEAMINTLLPDERGPREVCHVVFHDADAMVGAWAGARTARQFVVRVNVPGNHMSDHMRAETVERLTRALETVESDPDRLYDEPAVWVHIVEVPDGNMGLFGKIVRIGDLIKIALDPGYRPGLDTRKDEHVETVIDPICGMKVPLTADAVVVEHDGTTFGFCSTSCRDQFVAAHRGDVTALKSPP